jgi:hypothetical protein
VVPLANKPWGQPVREGQDQEEEERGPPSSQLPLWLLKIHQPGQTIMVCPDREMPKLSREPNNSFRVVHFCCCSGVKVKLPYATALSSPLVFESIQPPPIYRMHPYPV